MHELITLIKRTNEVFVIGTNEKQLTKYSIRERNIAGAISRRDDATTIDDDEANYDDSLIIPLIHTPFLATFIDLIFS